MTTLEAADRLDLKPRRIRDLIHSGQLAAEWDDETRSWIIDPASVEKHVRKGPGRPKTSGT